MQRWQQRRQQCTLWWEYAHDVSLTPSALGPLYLREGRLYGESASLCHSRADMARCRNRSSPTASINFETSLLAYVDSSVRLRTERLRLTQHNLPSRSPAAIQVLAEGQNP